MIFFQSRGELPPVASERERAGSKIAKEAKAIKERS